MFRTLSNNHQNNNKRDGEKLEGARSRPNGEFPSEPGQAPALPQAWGCCCQVDDLFLANHESKTLLHVINKTLLPGIPRHTWRRWLPWWQPMVMTRKKSSIWRLQIARLSFSQIKSWVALSSLVVTSRISDIFILHLSPLYDVLDYTNHTFS